MSTVSAGLYFAYGVFVVFTTVNAFRRPSVSRLPPIWILGMLNGELPLMTLASRLAVTALAWAGGAFRSPVGRAGLWLTAASLLGLASLVVRARRVGGGDAVPPDSRLAAFTGWPRRLPPDLEVVGTFAPGPGVTVDFYRRRDQERRPLPTLVYLHGGSWSGGSPHTQARPLIHHLARNGWLVATVSYPLSPRATFPDHLVGVKRAIAWLRDEGRHQGVDPKRIAIAGGSAGGHLASLAALTPDRPDLQPGFEQADTSVAACISLYGIYDFLNRNRTRHDWPVIPRHVMKADPATDQARYRDASPIDQVRPDAVPFLVIHGTQDSLVPPDEARVFVAALRAVSTNPVEFVEVEGAQHAFDAVSSPRSRMVTAVAADFLARHVVGQADEPARP